MLKIAIVVIVVVAALVAFIATRPSRFRVARSRVLTAPPEVVYAFIHDFHKWPLWSPWERLDPGMKREHTGPPAGRGASYGWVGNRAVGEGRMTITDSRENQSVTIRLELIRPFKATNVTEIDLAPSGAGTNVTWAMTGDNNFLAKAFHLLMSMDKIVGGDFEKGLANLDAVSAARPAQAVLP